MCRVARHLLLAALCAALLPSAARASLPDGFNHTELTWYMLTTEHFKVIYHQGLEEAAQVVARKAEEVYPRITKDIGCEPHEKTPIIIAEYTTIPLEQATQLEHQIHLIGNIINDARIDRDTWLEALIAHEFTHICTYWKIRGRLSFLTEYINAPQLPEWFYEGLAEGAASRWSQHGGYSILRAAVLEDDITSLAALDTFDTDDLTDQWLLYAVGHSIVTYIVNKYGPQCIPEILDKYSKLPAFDRALRETIGVGQNHLYQEWKKFITDFYREMTRGRTPVQQYSKTFPTTLHVCFGGRWSPDGKKIAILAMKHIEEQFVQLYIANSDGSNLHPITNRVTIYGSQRFSWSPDSRYLAYAGFYSSPNGHTNTGIYLYDTQTGTHRRITGEEKAVDPAFSPDGKKIAFVLYQEAGRYARIAIMDADGGNVKILTASPDLPENCFGPTWSPDGKRLAFEVVVQGIPNIATINADGTGFQLLTADTNWNRSPAWSPDGTKIAFISAADGVPNVYTIDVATKKITKHTNEGVGSCYDPTWTPDGKGITFSLFKTRRATLETIPAGHTEPLDVEKIKFIPPGAEDSITYTAKPAEKTKIDTSNWSVEKYRSFKEVKMFLARPLLTNDSLGVLNETPLMRDSGFNAVAVRAFFEDPLEQHVGAIQITRGLASRRTTWLAEYLNSQKRYDMFFTVFDRFSPPRTHESATVFDEYRGAAFRITYPRLRNESVYDRDIYRAGLELIDMSVAAQTAPTSTPAGSGTLSSFSVGWDRVTTIPTKGVRRYSLTVRHALPRLSDFALRDIQGTIEYTKTSSGQRERLTVGLDAVHRDFELPDRLRIRGTALMPRVQYTWRISNDKNPHNWPYWYMDRTDARLTYQYIKTFGNRVFPDPDGHLLRAEIINRGYLTRGFPYTIRAGVEYYTAVGKANYFFRFGIHADEIFGF